MNDQEIFELMARFDASAATKMKLSVGNFSLELEKDGAAASCGAAPTPLPRSAEDSAAPAGTFLTAPLVGTFYLAPEPGAEPFVRPGQRVEKGQTVAMLEAMKMMSEVQAPCDCVIQEVLAQDGALVSFGDPLMRYQEG